MPATDNRKDLMLSGISDDPTALARLTLSEFVTQLTVLGIEVRARDGKLQLTAPVGALTATLQAELRRRKPELLGLLTAHEAEGEERLAPLTFAQQRLWLIDRFSPNGTAYNIPQSWTVNATIDREAFRQAIDRLAERHHALRTRIQMRDGEAVQVVLKQVTIPLEFTDLGAELDSVKQAAELDALLTRKGQETFPLDQAPLIRFHLIRLTEERYVVAYNMHHIISDQWSLNVLKHDLSEIYLEAIGLRTAILPTLKVQYADVAARERSEAATRLYGRQLEYWRDRLQGMPTLLELPFSKSRPLEQTFSGATLTTAIDEGLTRKLKRLAAQSNTSLYLLMLSVFAVLLNRYTNVKDLCIGTPITGRKTHDEEHLIGLFVNMLPLRMVVEPAESFTGFLKRVGNAALTDFEHSELPFQKLVMEMHPHRSPSYSPLFQIMFALNPKSPEDIGDQKETYIGVSKFDLTLQLEERADTMLAHLEYKTDLFDAASIEQLSRHLVTLSRSIVEHPESSVGALPLLDEEDRETFLRWNATELSFDRSSTLVSLFEEQVRMHPDAPALYASGTMYTFQQLSLLVNSLASSLNAHGASRGSFVALCQSRKLDLIVSMLAVLKTGAAYVPLDPKYPEDRLAYMLADSGTLLMLTERTELSERLAASNSDLIVLYAAEELEASGKNRSKAEASEPACEDAAYLIYTSGSTGKPKGVVVEHRNAVSLIAWARDFFEAQSITGMLASTSVCFDLSIFEIFLPLSTGNAIVLVENVLELGVAPHGDKVTLVNTVPSAMSALLQAGLPATVRTVCMAGEFLPAELVDRVYSAGVKQVFDLYGPTETTTYSTGALRIPGAAATIGMPIANTRVYLLDDQLMQVPRGCTGEIFIGGEGVTRGYLHRPGLTDERFLTLPLIEPHGRLYRTGDLARYSTDGSLIYQGRRDNQIKLRGHRIELGEIEEALREVSGASQLAVVVQRREAGDSLVAFIATPDAALNVSECLAALYRRLPAYMVPSQIIQMDSLPLTPNGKIDRKALTVPDEASTGHTVEMPRDLLEQWLANIWCDRLGKKQIARDAHFFDDLGGHSLVAFEIFAQIEKRLGVAMMLATLFQAPTIELLAAAIRRLRWKLPESFSFLSPGVSEAVIYGMGLDPDATTDDVRNTIGEAKSEARLMLLAKNDSYDVESAVREIAAFEAARPSLILLARGEIKDKAEKLATGLLNAGFPNVLISRPS